MKALGIVRRMDCLGRIVVPIELRRILGIAEKDGLEIYVDQDRIILRKYEPACIFCGSTKGTKEINGKKVCTDCRVKISRAG